MKARIASCWALLLVAALPNLAQQAVAPVREAPCDVHWVPLDGPGDLPSDRPRIVFEELTGYQGEGFHVGDRTTVVLSGRASFGNVTTSSGLAEVARLTGELLMVPTPYGIPDTSSTTLCILEAVPPARFIRFHVSVEVEGQQPGEAFVYAWGAAHGERAGALTDSATFAVDDNIDEDRDDPTNLDPLVVTVGEPYEAFVVGPSPERPRHGEEATVELWLRIRTQAEGLVNTALLDRETLALHPLAGVPGVEDEREEVLLVAEKAHTGPCRFEPPHGEGLISFTPIRAETSTELRADRAVDYRWSTDLRPVYLLDVPESIPGCPPGSTYVPEACDCVAFEDEKEEGIEYVVHDYYQLVEVVGTGEGVRPFTPPIESVIDDLDEPPGVFRQADVGVELSVPSPVEVDQPFTIEVRVPNLGPDAATGVELELEADPPILELSGDARCTMPASDRLRCTSDETLEPGTELFWFFDAMPREVGAVRLDARVRSDQEDPDPGNNQTSQVLEVERPGEPDPQEADLALTKTARPTTVDAGATVTYTITVANQGPDDAVNVRLGDQLPPEVTILDGEVSASQGFCEIPIEGILDCHLLDLAAGDSLTVTVVAKVRGDASGSFRNNADVFSRTTDPESGNNHAAATVRVRRNRQVTDFTVQPRSLDKRHTVGDSPCPDPFDQPVRITSTGTEPIVLEVETGRFLDGDLRQASLQPGEETTLQLAFNCGTQQSFVENVRVRGRAETTGEVVTRNVEVTVEIAQ